MEGLLNGPTGRGPSCPRGKGAFGPELQLEVILYMSHYLQKRTQLPQRHGKLPWWDTKPKQERLKKPYQKETKWSNVSLDLRLFLLCWRGKGTFTCLYPVANCLIICLLLGSRLCERVSKATLSTSPESRDNNTRVTRKTWVKVRPVGDLLNCVSSTK